MGFIHSQIQSAIISNQLNNLVKTVFKPRYFTSHEVKTPFYLRGFIGVFGGYFALHFLVIREIAIRFCWSVKKHCNIDKHLLIFVPNEKYVKFFLALKPFLKNDYLVVSDSSLSIESINVRKKPFNGVIKCSFKTYLVINRYVLANLLFNFSEAKGVLLNIHDIYKLIYYSCYFKIFFQHHRFNKFFSFLPSGDIHNIIVRFYANRFAENYAIRPDTTGYSEEHRHLVCNNLFFKNKLEEKIYRTYNLHDRMQLLQAGLIEKEKTISNDGRSKILVLDTALSKNSQSKRIRKNTLEVLYNSIKLYNSFLIEHRFHPALNRPERTDTLTLLSAFNVAVNQDRESDLFNNVSVVISFYSTLLYTCFLNQIPVIMIQGELALSELDENITNSPIVKVNTERELKSTIKKLIACKSFTEVKQFCKTSEVRTWFAEYYNYPDGMQSVANALNAKN